MKYFEKETTMLRYKLVLLTFFCMLILSSCGETSHPVQSTPAKSASPSGAVVLTTPTVITTLSSGSTPISTPTVIVTPMPGNISLPTPTVIVTPTPGNIPLPTPTVIVTPTPGNIPLPTPVPTKNPSPTPTTTPASAGTMALNYYQALKSHNYTQAYTYLDANAVDTITGQKLTQSTFALLAQNSESAGGPISSFSAATFAPLVVMTVSRNGGPYHVHLQVKLEGNQWKIISLDRI